MGDLRRQHDRRRGPAVCVQRINNALQMLHVGGKHTQHCTIVACHRQTFDNFRALPGKRFIRSPRLSLHTNHGRDRVAEFRRVDPRAITGDDALRLQSLDSFRHCRLTEVYAPADLRMRHARILLQKLQDFAVVMINF